MNNYLGEHEPCEPFVVRGYNVPGRVFRGSIANHVFVSILVVVPALALVYVARREFPVLLRLVQTRQKTFLLLFFGDVEEKLANDGSVTGQVFLKRSDVVKSFFPYVLGHERFGNSLVLQQIGMDAHDQHFFIIRAVENADMAALRKTHGGSPEKIVLQFLERWLLEGKYLTALRIDSRHNVLDGAVLSGSIQCLED